MIEYRELSCEERDADVEVAYKQYMKTVKTKKDRKEAKMEN